MWARWLAVFVCVSLSITAASDPAVWRQAQVNFLQHQEQWESVFRTLPRCGKIDRLDRFIKRWYSKWDKGNYTCKDDSRSGRPRLMDLLEAAQAANFVKKGRWVQIKRGKKTFHRLVYFTSIQDAVDHVPELQELIDRYGCTVEQLREALHAADPALKRRRITFKRALSNSEKQDRVQQSEQLLARYSADPSMLQRMVFIDETTIVLAGGNHDHVHAWCDAHDVNFADVCPLPIPDKKHPTKVHIIAAVSAHPAFAATNGLVYVDFTTGTSHIHRRHNKRMDGSQAVPDYNYQVGAVAWMLHRV
jgi:hypothetical protein